ncbi:hypothetical protein [Bacteroides bouchesdurhonensis]|uniref:hypothetical protein n=1 Tax=Bacteroides bouchesdurhonensis TaxID=1841855 RepID=UPI00135644EF|nr:hypothetical protein [Bacteroides bouchesdurhonensis]
MSRDLPHHLECFFRDWFYHNNDIVGLDNSYDSTFATVCLSIDDYRYVCYI